jgi:hypothetical protein
MDKDAAEELVGKLGCAVIIIRAVILVAYLEKKSEATKKARIEAAGRIRNSFNLEVERILPVLDSHTSEPERGSRISGKYVVSELGVTGQSTGHQIDPRTSPKGAAKSFSIFPDLEGDSYGPSKTPALVIVRGSLHDAATIKKCVRGSWRNIVIIPGGL